MSAAPQQSVTPQVAVDALRAAVGDASVLTDPADRLSYGYDNSRRIVLPDAVVFAQAHGEVAAVVHICNQHRVPVVARGRGTNTTGATVPVAGGIVLSLERMNRIVRLSSADRVAVVEPGVTNADLQHAAGEHGFFWPCDPSSAAYCTVGGNLGCNAAGPRAVKYGTPRDHTLGLLAVTGTGETLRTGVTTTKGVVGYDLTRLIIGSEGTLAIITQATLKLTPKAAVCRLLRVVYRDVAAAAAAVARIMAQPETPCALEFIDAEAVALIRHYSANHGIALELPVDAGAMLLVEVDGGIATIGHAVESVTAAAQGDGLSDLRIAADEAETKRLWETRKALSPALRTLAPRKINEDVVVPVSQIPALIDGLSALSQKFGIRIVNFGHAGNGNIHVNLLGDPEDARQTTAMRDCLDAVFTLVLELGGTLSGEHGVGVEKRPFVSRELEPTTLSAMREIKRVFDPNGILNPGKLLPDCQ